MKYPITAIVHTLNEEQNIRNCLECLKWAGEILVVDMFSEDRTVEIAREYTNKILTFERCGYVEPARQFAIDRASHDWVLIVDADELVPVSLRDHLIELAVNDAFDVVWLPRVNYFFGKVMRGSSRGVDQEWHLRFLKKGYVEYTSKIHGIPKVRQDSRMQYLQGEEHALVHFNYIDFDQFFEKFVRYTSIEAKNDYLAGKKFNWQEAWQKSMDRFKFLAVTKEGWQRDGALGIGFAFLEAAYHLVAALKLKTMEECSSTDPGTVIRRQYQEIADALIKQYEVDAIHKER